MEVSFWIVDTFSTKPLCGSPSAVVLLDDFSNEQLMQNIAMELNVPETAFVRTFGHSDYEIACFCPLAKGLYFGNSLFASAHILSTEKIMNTSSVNLVYGSRIFETSILENGKINIRLSLPTINKIPMPDMLPMALNGVIIVSVVESKGALIVEVRSPSKIANLNPNIDMLRRLEQDIVIITADTHYETDIDYDFCARVFAPNLGVVEDKVTPLAHSRLASYWQDRIAKNDLIGYQDSRNAGYVGVQCADEYVYVSGFNTTITKGVLFL